MATVLRIYQGDGRAGKSRNKYTTQNFTAIVQMKV